MTIRRLGVAATVLIADAVLLLVVGSAMWSEAPSPADEAVGKGLFALGAALAIPTFAIVCAYLTLWSARAPSQPPARNDSDAV